MSEEVRRRISNSAYDFERVVWPEIRDRLGGDLISVEIHSSEKLASTLDIDGGIDAIWRSPEGHLKGVGCRVQWFDDLPAWMRTFTIRYRLKSGANTEYQKRVAAIEDGELIKPDWTAQAYLTPPEREGELMDGALISTTKLYAYVVDRVPLIDGVGRKYEIDGVGLRHNPDGNDFIYVKWDMLGIKSFRQMSAP